MGATASRALPSGRVAILFSDIQGSTALLNRLGEAYGDVLDEHDRVMRETFAAYGGHEFSNEGDAFGAAFGDPAAAARAALEVQRRLDATPWPDGERVRVRMGLHYGEPKVRGHDYWGEDVHFAARVCSAAHGGQVIISAAMRATVAADQAISLGRHGLKDFPTPRELFQLTAPGEAPEEFPAPRTLSTFRSNLPSIATPIVGRDDVLDDLERLFLADGQRLVTLVGAGGMGKTRAAVAFGERVAARLPDGVSFVPLAAVDGAGVAAAVAEATGAPRGGAVDLAVVAHLEQRRMLLVLDNCEHVAAPAAALLTRILEHCPGVAVLATAQLPLDLTAEVVRRLEPLAGAGASMFVQRVVARDPSFRPSDADRERIQRLCDLLDGLPLAIELAAARVRLLGVDRLLAALQRDLDALGTGSRDLPERQRSLRAALDWTLTLLTPVERTVFTALGAFAASWSLEEAEDLLAEDLDSPEVWEAMTRLMDASLVVVRGDGRLAMPQRVRQHAAELLASSPDAERIRRRHAEVIGLEARELALDMFIDYHRQLANIVDLLPEVRHALAWSRATPVVHRHVIGLVARALAKTGDVALVAVDLEEFPPPPPEPADYDDAAHCFALGLLHAMRWSTDTDAEVGLFDRACRGFRVHGDPREEVIGHYQALGALAAGGRTAEIADRISQLRGAATRTDDHRWIVEATRITMTGWENDEDSAVLDGIVAELGLGTGGFAAMFAGLQAQAALRRQDLPSAADWLVECLRRDPRDQLYLVLSDVKVVCALLALAGEDAEAYLLRSAINHLYRRRTKADHGDIVATWTSHFAASEARLSDGQRAALAAAAAEITFDELVDRGLAVAQRFGSAGVEERA